MADDLKQRIHRLGSIEADRFSLFLEMIEPKLQEICDEMRALKAGQDKANATNDRLLKKNELAENLQVSVSTVNKLQADGLPLLKCKNAVRYEYDKVLDWLRDRTEKESNNRRLRMVA